MAEELSKAKRTCTTRNRTGCLTCRQRKKRCDSSRTRCGHCSRLNLVCRWQSPQDLSANNPITSHTDSSGSSAVTIPTVLDPLYLQNSEICESTQQSSYRKLALRYYIQTFTPMLTTSLENNGFLSVLLPLAIEDKPLLDMLIAWSSSHLSLWNDVYHVKALEHRSTALTSFATSLSTNHDSPEVKLAGCLVFCSMSAILGDTTGWHNHLHGAAQIIKYAGALSPNHDGLAAISSSYEGRWLLRNFAYHDILMSITSDREPLMKGQYWVSEPKSTIDSYFGLASQPMALLSKISSLNSDMLHETSPSSDDAVCSPSTSERMIDASPTTETSFSSRAYSIERELQEWNCPESTDPYLISLAETYRSAALIYLYRVIRRHVPSTGERIDLKIKTQVSLVVQHAGAMPVRCLPECTLLFPLFMAGGETTSKSEIQFIRNRLQHINDYRHFQNAASALSVLEELWLQHTSFTGLVTGEPLDWLDILRRRDWKLALS